MVQVTEESNLINYIDEFMNLCDQLEFYYQNYWLNSSTPNIDEQNKLLAKVNKLSNWIRNDNTISDEDKYTLLGDELYN